MSAVAAWAPLTDADVIRAVLRKKLEALTWLWRFLRIVERPPSPLNAEQQQALVESVRGRLSQDIWPEQRMAAKLLLEMGVPEWRALAPELAPTLAERDSREYHAWRKAVLVRDDHVCADCGATELLCAHHLARWVDAPLLRLEVANGVTVCQSCHVQRHRVGR